MSLLYKFPPFNECVLDNGLRLILLPDDEQDGLVVLHQFPFGRFTDPVSKEGLTDLTTALMQKGTKNLNSEQFSETFENKGAMLITDVSEEHTVLGMKMLSLYSDELLPVFFDMIFNPRLAKEEFSRIQREMATSLKAEQIEPSIIAQRHFHLALVGKEHPAGRFHSVKSVGGIKREDIVAFHKDYFTPSGSIVIVAGKFDADDFEKKHVLRLKQWGCISNVEQKSVTATNTGNRENRFVDKPDLTQATLILGHIAPGENDSKRNEIALANYILGGGNFSSRLMERIRSKDGKTYGINSQIQTQRNFGVFTISTSTQNSQVVKVITDIKDTLNSFIETGVTQKELDTARKFAIGNMAFQLEGIGSVAEKLLWLRYYNRKESYIEKFDEMLNAISIESINETIKEVFVMSKLVCIIVGKKKEILPQLKEIGPFAMYHFRDKL